MQLIHVMVAVMMALPQSEPVQSGPKLNVKSVQEDFTTIRIPEAYLSSQTVGVAEIHDIIVKTPSGQEFSGQIKLILPLDDEPKLLYLGISSSILNATGLDSDFWIENPGTESTIGECLEACANPSIPHPRWCRITCWAEAIAGIITPFILVLID